MSGQDPGLANAGTSRRRELSVRRKLLLLSAVPVLVTGALLTVLFIWANKRTSRAYEDATAWHDHAHSLQNLNSAARFYFDNVADGLVRDPLPHDAESRELLARARAESLLGSRRFSSAEHAADQRVDALLSEFVEEGDRVGKDPQRLNALADKYKNVIRKQILARVEQEEAGSARAIRAATDLSHTVRVSGFVVAVVALLSALGASAIAVRGFAARVASLEAAAARVATGLLDTDVPVTSSDELGRLAVSLNMMIDALRRQRTRKLAFLAAVAHDLRNPLAPMRLSIEALLQSTHLPPEPSLRKSLALINRQTERLSHMADDLLDATSIEAGELTLTPVTCDVAAVARDVIDLYAGASSRHEIRLSAPTEPVTLVCDPTRIAQVLENLVSNAIKYSPAGGTVDMTITAVPEEVIISVTDTGLGIDPKMFGSIFEPFRRVPTPGDVLPGVGLGLSTCRRIVMAHHGTIDVASELGRGATFRITLPRTP